MNGGETETQTGAFVLKKDYNLGRETLIFLLTYPAAQILQSVHK